MNFDGMWLPAGEDPREPASPPRGEVDTLLDYLEAYRTTLRLKCDGLDPEELARRSVPPSTLSLLGLVRHMARVEHHWFHRVIAGNLDEPRLHPHDHGFEEFAADQASVDDAFSSLAYQVERSRKVLATTSLDTLITVHDEQIEVRDVVVHMIEEYARHCGHADLLRECIDGRTGQ
ncbi:DinB family protein [Nocardioides sp. Bht2]|uniref:DinB family protein n=1 Tax=Nocardioides sp. Bht2 TaxID=3392297 RepID=UPI0039B52CE5